MKRASEVPPEVLNSGRRPVTSSIAATARSVKAPGFVTNTFEFDGSQTMRAWIRLPAAFFFRAEDGIRGLIVTGVQTCALPISRRPGPGDGPHPAVHDRRDLRQPGGR